MFKKGLRLTADVIPGHPVREIGEELDRKLQEYRPSEYDQIKPTIVFVSECAGRVLADEFGKVAERTLQENTLKIAWEMTLFLHFLKKVCPAQTEYEKMIADVESLYAEVPSN